MSGRKSKSGYLADYALDDKYLLKPDRKQGRAGIDAARTRDSREVLIKTWPRAKGVDDQDLEMIWRSEIRQLQRLSAVPRADELLVPMVGSGKDNAGFYLVLDPAQGSPLDVFLNASRKPPLLAQARQPRIRRLLWANILRIVNGVELLHSQGTIHRNIDPWSIVTALDDEPDFRLTGFEWSMRIAAIDANDEKKIKAPREERVFSFARDWRDLAHLAAVILDIPLAPLNDLKIVASRIADHVSAAEARLLRAMLGLEHVERLDGEYIATRMQAIIDGITAEVAGREAALCLAVRLGSGSPLSEAIRKASGAEIEVTDDAQQLRFIRDDLGEQTQLVAIREGESARYALFGRSLNYRLTPYRRPNSPDAPNWEFAYSERVDLDPPAKALVIGETLINTASLEIIRSTDAAQSFPRRRGRVQHWEEYIDRTVEKTSKITDTVRMHQAFALLLILEMAYAAADIFPIEVISRGGGESIDQKNIHIISRVDRDRAALSSCLGLDAPAVRLRKLLSSETPRDEGAWIFSEPGTLGERSPTSTAWRFMDFEELNDVESMKFEGQTLPQTRSFGFLIPADMAGRIAQFKRRLKALGALRNHGELLRMFVDPRMRIEDSQDPLDESAEAFKELDRSKQSALREILSTLPLFLLQGPPGVGKTYLVGDLVARRIGDDSTARILLSAQSNSAIDHLMKEVRLTFKSADEDNGPLMVRARAADDDDAGELEIDVQADKLLQELSASSLMEEASAHLISRVKALASAKSSPGAGRSGGNGSSRRIAAELRAFEGMILRAANLVFATTNSAAIERLIEEQGLFDWTVVEEAGKATGGELLSPLLLSHRRLMIGDHKQLPPFDVEKTEKLLSSTAAVQEVVKLVDRLVSRYLKDSGIDETFDEVSKAGDDFGRTCAEALSLLTLFETFVERELSRQKRKDVGPRIARRLSEQYRMHPAIARIVSKCFYEGTLDTNAKKAAKFASEAPPVKSSNQAILPDKPIVFIDMPFAREEGPGGRGGEKAPPWSNPDEAVAVTEVLKLLSPSVGGGEAPSLAVLSPYWQQVRRIESLIDKGRAGPLSNLSGFAPAVDDNGFCGTVDSFQGGEADVVVVSLVRNNHHTTPARALGFLRDNRRMNVILSRAKWRLIVVGSLSFYKYVVSKAKYLPDQDIGFLSDFLSALEAEEKLGNASIVPWASLRGAKK